MNIKILLRKICIIDIILVLFAYKSNNTNGIIMNSAFAIVMAILSLDKY